MEFRKLEDLLIDLAGDCERLTSILESERQAMTAWQVERIDELTFEKEAALATIRMKDREFRDQLELVCHQLACSADQIFSHPGADRLRQLKARLDALTRVVRTQGERNRQIATHVVAFLAQLQGVPGGPELSTYGPSGATYHGNLVHHIL